MSNVTRVKLADRIERQVEERGLEIELSDGTTVYVAPPELWTAEQREVAKNLDGTRDERAEQVARAALGDEAWERFVADGGTPSLFDLMVNEKWAAPAGESQGSSTS